MRRAPLMLSALLLLSSCRELRAVSPPYFDGVFVGHYVTPEDPTPVAMRLEVEASEVEGKRYTVTGSAELGGESFAAEGYELASYNLTYLAPQAPPPPMGNTVISFKDEAGTTAYTLCAGVIYRDYDDLLWVNYLNLLEGSLADANGDDSPYCAPYADFAYAELEKQPD